MNDKARDVSETAGYIVTFSDIRLTRVIPAERIYNELREAGRWYVRRNVKLQRKSTIFFYRNGIGIVGHGIVNSCGPVDNEDARFIQRLDLDAFRSRIVVDDWKTLDQPLHLRTAVNALDFVRDKRNWGGSLQTSPVRITSHDVQYLFALIANETS